MAYLSSAEFRAEIAEIDRTFQPLSGWSIGARLEATIPAGELEQTSVAQPLIYAIQSALTAILMRRGSIPRACSDIPWVKSRRRKRRAF